MTPHQMSSSSKFLCALSASLVWILAPFSAIATPLDDRIAEFDMAADQNETVVLRVLQQGLKENRSARAYAATKAWLAKQPDASPNLNYHAGMVAERAGEWTAAAGFLRKLIQNPKTNPAQLNEVVPKTYRLLINQLDTPATAYLMMREDGGRLRGYGDARKFDHWFLDQARSRNDLPAMAERLALILNTNDPIGPYQRHLNALHASLETYQFGDKDLFEALDKLAAARRATAIDKARVAWVKEIVPLSKMMAERVSNRKEIPETILTTGIQSANALVVAQPYEGSIAVIKGWMHYNQGDTPTFDRFVATRRAEKAAPILAALPKLTADQAREILGLTVAVARSRRASDHMFSRAELRALVPLMPEVFNSLNAPATSFIDAEITIEEARKMAPNLARNPHTEAAVIRIMASGIKKFTDATEQMVKSEAWRFNDIKAATHGLWHNPWFERVGKYEDMLKKHDKFAASYQKLSGQVTKNANPKLRQQAFNELYKDLSSNNPSIPGALALWDELFKNASDREREEFFKTMSTGLMGDGLALFQRAAANSFFGGQRYAILHTGSEFSDNWQRWGRAHLIKQLPAFADHLAGMLKGQMNSEISKPVLSAWLHCVDSKKPENRNFMKGLARSPAYAKLSVAYRRLAGHPEIFGSLAVSHQGDPNHPATISRELLALGEKPDPSQVEQALEAVTARARANDRPVTVIGLQAVAKLEHWSPATRERVISLFHELAPIGSYPAGQGYEALVVRMADEFTKGGDVPAIEAHAAGLWRSADATDDSRTMPGAQALNKCISKAMEAGHYSVVATLTRCAQRSPVSVILSNSDHPPFRVVWDNVRQSAGIAAAEIGAIEIPVDESDPTYPIYRSHSEYILGNLETSWELYTKHREKLPQVITSLTPEYGLWLLERSVRSETQDKSEELVKQLTLWSRNAEGTFNAQQDASLRVSYADLAFRKGALPTARALYRRVADAAEYRGSEMHLRAALGSVRVDMASKNYSAALDELDKLIRLRNPDFRIRIHYAKAEVLMEQENFTEALEELEAVLRREPKHPDALLLRGKIHYQMRKLVEASEIELGPSQDETVLVPGEALKINLRDPSLQVSGLGADIEVEVRTKSGDVERLLLHPFGDSKEKFRAEIVTELGAPRKGDKVLQVLGVDEITYGYSKRFRDRMEDLPDDPDTIIEVASDAQLALTAGSFPAREGERQLNIDELGLSTAQKALGLRSVRPGNNVYMRVIDADRSTTAGIDEISVELLASSGDSIRKLTLRETSEFSGEFQAEVPTAPAQAIAFASESTAGRDPNMAISRENYPGWQAEVGEPDKVRTFGVDLNDNVPLKSMSLITGESEQSLSRFVLQTSMNGKQWESVARFPAEPAPWDGRPQISSFPTFGANALPFEAANDRNLPNEWREKMEVGSMRKGINYLSAHVTHLGQDKLPLVNTGHPGYSGLFRFRAIFYQPQIAVRSFKLEGLPLLDKDGKHSTILLIDGQPAANDQEDPLTITRELAPGLHTIEVWCHMARDKFEKSEIKLLQDQVGKQEMIECPSSMFDITKFPEEARKQLPQPATITESGNKLDIEFGEHSNARMVRLVILGFEGLAPSIRKLTLDDRAGETLLPVEQDYQSLRQNLQLEVLPGDTITVRYEDPVSATPKRNRHQKSLGVAYNTGTLTASFLNYEMNKEGERVLVLEPIRRFRLDDAIAIVIEDADLDATAQRDTVEFSVSSQESEPRTIKALETENHSGVFIGRVFPVEGEPSRSSEIKIRAGGTLTATYRDTENLEPGIPTDRSTTISHALYATPEFEAYNIASEALPEPKREPTEDRSAPSARDKRGSGPELVTERRSLSYIHVPTEQLDQANLGGIIGGTLNLDIIMPHMALAGSSTINAYVQTDAARKAAKLEGNEFSVTVPGTLKIKASLGRGEQRAPEGYRLANGPVAPTRLPALEEGRFKISVPLALGDPPKRSFADSSADELPDSSIPDALAVKAGDIVHIGFPWQDPQDKVHWKEVTFSVGANAMLDIMDGGYRDHLFTAYVGEKVYLRMIAPGLDQSPIQDKVQVQLQGSSGAKADYTLQETEPHSGVFKSSFTIAYADETIPAKLPPVELNGFPVRYGETITISYMDQSHEVTVKKGANGLIEPFSKRFTGDEMAVRTSFTLAECYFELAKKHREMEKESLARREIGQARKLLSEALATHKDESLKAHAEYLLGNLAQEFADLAKNDDAKLPMYQDALARFSKIPTDWPDSEFAPKAQYKTALVYEKMGEIENSVEEYVKLAYKYPDDELIPMVMSRLGGYFQQKGQEYKERADPLRESKEAPDIAEVLRLDQLSYPEFLKASMVFAKLQERFPDDPLAGNAGLRAAQNLMRAHQYGQAIDQFKIVIEHEDYDDNSVRAQAMYWSGLAYERAVSLMSEDNWRGRGDGMREAYELYRRLTFDFPDSKWAKYARGRLADPAFADIIEKENSLREKMLEALKEQQKKRR